MYLDSWSRETDSCSAGQDFQYLMEFEGAFQCQQEAATGPYA
jgi:hypothetical protein